jgi:hypothetical protein
MNWAQRNDRHESDVGYVVVGTRGRHGLTYNAWLPMGAGFLKHHDAQSSDLDRCKRACEEHYRNSIANNQGQMEFQR